MKNIFKILTISLFLLGNKLSAQCGLTLNYSWLSGPCDTLLHDVSVQISNSSCTTFTYLWENNSTAPSTQLDTGYHYIYITDCNNCVTVDTFFIGCAGWNGNTGISEVEDISAITITPNPSSDLIFITSKHKEIDQIYIYNTSGIIIKEYKNVSSNKFLVNISELTYGLYLLKIKKRDKYSISRFLKDN